MRADAADDRGVWVSAAGDEHAGVNETALDDQADG